MGMTEVELVMHLGILPEPEQNRVCLNPYLEAELSRLTETFETSTEQKSAIGTLPYSLWSALLPWHSLN